LRITRILAQRSPKLADDDRQAVRTQVTTVPDFGSQTILADDLPAMVAQQLESARCSVLEPNALGSSPQLIAVGLELPLPDATIGHDRALRHPAEPDCYLSEAKPSRLFLSFS
jgi:hypothetical protein